MKNDLKHGFLNALAGRGGRRPPVWIMRQTGRYMPAYRELRQKISFLELCKTPELVAKVTLWPVEQLGVDAAIVFADLLLPLEPMGVKLEYEEGGPTLHPVVRSMEGLKALRHGNVEKDLDYVAKAVALTRKRLEDRVPLIGFAGSPFTLSCYLTQGGGSMMHSGHFEDTKWLLYSDPGLFKGILESLTETLKRFVALQVGAGAQCIQLFDTWGGILSRPDYERFALPPLQNLFAEIRRLKVPSVLYLQNAAHLLPLLPKAGADALSLDWRLPMAEVRKAVGPDIALQGNLDPAALLGNPGELRRRTTDLLSSMDGDPAYVFNLGHGILPSTPFDNAKLLVDTVKAHGR